MEDAPRVRLGQPVPDFEVRYYDPAAHEFGDLSLEQLKRDGRWTILFFYLGDFTFV